MIKEIAYAKINLSLEITEKRPDGFHNLNSIMIPIKLHDVLTFEECDDVIIEGNIEIEDNNMYETVQKVKSHFGVNKGVKLTFVKNIPLGAGLGGGSANIAAVIRGVNRLWGLNKPLTELEELAISLGSDTLHCLYNRPSHVYSRGDMIEFIPPPKASPVFLICSHDILLTRDVFANHQQLKKESAYPELIKLYQNDFDRFLSLTNNDLLYATLSLSRTFAKNFYAMKKFNPYVHMSGSGPTMFIVGKPTKAMLDYIKENDKNIFGISTTFLV